MTSLVYCLIYMLLIGYSVGIQSSCEGRCGDNLDPDEPCQCNSQCTSFGDCCEDYEELCLNDDSSCEGRCGDYVDHEKPCQCNDDCVNFGDCCEDYEELCLAITDEDLLAIGEILWEEDVNRLPDSGYTLDTDGPTYFTYVDECHLNNHPTFNLLTKLYDNYNPNVGEEEDPCSSCETEINNFLDAVLQTSVMQEAWEFLAGAGLAADNLDEFKLELYQYWFEGYGRKAGGPVDSSGFEHVMIGEIDGSSVSGFHSWVKFYTEESNGNLEFYEQTGDCEPDYVKLAFDWNGNYKSGGSMFLATSPEFDLAAYTICFLARRNNVCTYSFGGLDVSIQTYDIANAGFLAVGSSYVIC